MEASDAEALNSQAQSRPPESRRPGPGREDLHRGARPAGQDRRALQSHRVCPGPLASGQPTTSPRSCAPGRSSRI